MVDIQIIFAFVLYLCVLAGIAVCFHQKLKNSADFIMGNRSLNFWVTALSAHASDMSAWMFMAFPASIFLGGLPALWTAIGLLVGMFFNWMWVAKPLRCQTEKYNSYTLSSYFQRRFNDHSGVLRLLTATVTLLFMCCYLAAGLIAMGFLFESVFEINYYVGLTIASIVVVAYTFAGGFATIAWTDLFQALFLLSAIIIVPLVAFFSLPLGFSSIESIANQNNITIYSLFDSNRNGIFDIFFLVFGWGLGYFGQPHIVTKFMGIKNPDDMVKSKWVGMSWQALALISAAAVGFVAIGFFPNTIENPELVFVEMVKQSFSPFFIGIILCAIIAATMSTMDSQILVCASVLSEDLYKGLLKPHASAEQILRISRFSVVVVAFFALIIAFFRSSTVLDSVLYAWSGLGCAFGPVVLMSLHSKWISRNGAIAGIVTGALVAGLWTALSPYFTYMQIPAMIPGFFFSLLSIWAFSFQTMEVEESVSL